MIKSLALSLLSMSLLSCASYPTSGTRIPATAGLTELQNVNITDVISLNSGYWDVKKGKDSYYGRYRAYILSGKADQDYNTLYVFAEKDGLQQLPAYNAGNPAGPKAKLAKQNDDSKFSLVSKNDKFIWGSDWAGTEPTLTVNKKGSLVINTLNEGVGRSAWNQQVIVRLNPETATMDVIGVEYSWYDKLDLSNGSCSYNFSTGLGIIKKMAAGADSDGNEIKNPKSTVKNVKVPTTKINLNDWKDTSEYEMLKDCFQ